MLITLISIYCDWVRLNCNSLLNVIHIGEYLHYNSCMYMCNMNILCLIFCNLQWVVVLSVSILIGASVIVRISLYWNAVVTLSAYKVCVPATYECTIDAIGCQVVYSYPSHPSYQEAFRSLKDISVISCWRKLVAIFKT